MMAKEIVIALVDGYIDDPAALGVPPYISPMIRSIAGAALDAGADRVEYISIDQIRKGRRMPEAAVTVVLSGNTVPGKYLRSMPMSLKELAELTPKLKGWRMISGSAADSKEAEAFDFIIRKDPAASLYDGIMGKEVTERYRTLEEWNRWMLLGADIVTQHQDFPVPLVAEIESYRGCHRYASGGCSYCIEPLKGKPLMRSPKDILAEAARLRELGIRNVRIGGQTCIVSYGSEDESETPRPNPSAVRELFEGLHSMGFDTIHVDNANPAVIATYPEESEEILRIIADNCTDGNVLALGMESADPFVITENNLNSTSDQVMDAVRLINRIGSERGPRGMPKLLPGINIICGLDGETKRTYEMDMEILERMREEGLMIRRINIRQVLPVRRPFDVRVDQRRFKKFKEDVREDIDRAMLERIVPYGTVLKDVYMELNDGNVTFGRQIGSYPLLIGVPYKVDTDRFYDIFVTEWGFRSITGITYPFDINHMPMSSLEGLPGIGKKRASKIVMKRPYRTLEELAEVVEDPSVIEGLKDIITLDDRRRMQCVH
jgi:radical SAM superfamily enzyme with C-terminal helix-hairpin-helix motif